MNEITFQEMAERVGLQKQIIRKWCLEAKLIEYRQDDSEPNKKNPPYFIPEKEEEKILILKDLRDKLGKTTSTKILKKRLEQELEKKAQNEVISEEKEAVISENNITKEEIQEMISASFQNITSAKDYSHDFDEMKQLILEIQKKQNEFSVPDYSEKLSKMEGVLFDLQNNKQKNTEKLYNLTAENVELKNKLKELESKNKKLEDQLKKNKQKNVKNLWGLLK